MLRNCIQLTFYANLYCCFRIGGNRKKNTLWNSLKCPESATESSYVCVIIDFFPLFFFLYFFLFLSPFDRHMKSQKMAHTFFEYSYIHSIYYIASSTCIFLWKSSILTITSNTIYRLSVTEKKSDLTKLFYMTYFD